MNYDYYLVTIYEETEVERIKMSPHDVIDFLIEQLIEEKRKKFTIDRLVFTADLS